MATEKRLIEELREMADRTPPICQHDKPYNTEIFGKEITVYCKPFEQFQELLRRAADALSVDAVEVSRLGRLGKLMMPYDGCPRGPLGASGEPETGKWKPMELDAIKDVDGNRWVPVLEQDLERLKGVEKVRCKDCKYWVEEKELGMFCGCWGGMLTSSKPDDYCSYGERKDNV